MVAELPILNNRNLLTHSGEQTYHTCPRKFWLRYVLGLRPVHDGDALRLGSAFHTGLEAFKAGDGEDAAADAVRDEYADATCPPWLSPEQFAVEEETAIALVRGYCRRYADDAIIEFVAVELSFDLPIINPTTGREHAFYRNAGKIDAIGRLPDGRLALVEHKTCGDDISPGAPYWRKLLMDAQISRYWLAAHAIGYPVETIIYDAVRKPEIKPKKVAKADRAQATSNGYYFDIKLDAMCPEQETPRMYGARLLADLSSRPEFYFNRVEIPRLDSDLREFAADQWATLKAIQANETDGHWPRHTGACTTFGACTYLDVCRGLRGDPNEQIPEGFRVADDLHPELNPENPAGAEPCPL